MEDLGSLQKSRASRVPVAKTPCLTWCLRAVLTQHSLLLDLKSGQSTTAVAKRPSVAPGRLLGYQKNLWNFVAAKAFRGVCGLVVDKEFGRLDQLGAWAFVGCGCRLRDSQLGPCIGQVRAAVFDEPRNNRTTLKPTLPRIRNS